MCTKSSAAIVRPKRIGRSVENTSQASLFDWPGDCEQASVPSARQRPQSTGSLSPLVISAPVSEIQQIRGKTQERFGGRTNLGKKIPCPRPSITCPRPPEAGAGSRKEGASPAMNAITVSPKQVEAGQPLKLSGLLAMVETNGSVPKRLRQDIRYALRKIAQAQGCPIREAAAEPLSLRIG